MSSELYLRMKRSGMGCRGFERLGHRVRQLVARARRPVEEWRVAFNILRVRMAAQLITRHPTRWRVVLNVLRRDRQLRKLLQLVCDPVVPGKRAACG